MDIRGWGGGDVTSSDYSPSWPCTDRNVRVQKIFNGYLRVTNENFLDAYENPNSTEFAELANKVKEAVSPTPGLEPCPCCVPWVRVGPTAVGRAPRSQDGGSGMGWDLGPSLLSGLC